MFVKKVKQPNGTHYLQLVESYKLNGVTKHRRIKALGKLEELEKENPNILEELKTKYREETEQQKERKEKKINIKDIEQYKQQNYGYFVLDAIYENLEISEYLNWHKENNTKIKYDLNNVMKLHVFSRILKPDSIYQVFKNKYNFYNEEMQLIKEKHMYRALDILNEIKDNLQFKIHKNILEKYGRDCSLVFYDVTNYYFEIHKNDEDIIDENGNVIVGLRKKGCSKKHMPQPLVAMALIIDKNNIPVAYQVFKGNTHDSKTLIPMIKELSEKYDVKKVIVVADKGINSENNLNFLVRETIEDDIALGGNGYIFSQTILGGTKELKETAIDQKGYVENDEKTYKKKSEIRTRNLYRKDEKGNNIKNTKIIVEEKVVYFWSADYAKRRTHKREEDRSKIEYFISNQDVLPKLDKGLKSYIKNIAVDENGKEIKGAKIRYIFDEDKFNKDAVYDGYYAIITSEINLTDDEIIEKYRGLSEIENSFRILQSDFDTRPIHVWTEDSIEGHFLICFIALTIMRILQNLTKHEVTVKNIKTKKNEKK